MNNALPVPDRHSESTASTLGNAWRACQPPREHRADIDGLRGAAVLSLLAVHLFPQWGRGGGLLGIDIFFVLSGFLISDTLFRAHETGQFKLAQFYVHRIRRIVPSLCVVLMACLAFSFLFAFPSDLRHIGKQVTAAALFLSNFTLWQAALPSDMGAAGEPLFHLWALAFEVQFYVLWPIALACVVGRKGRTTALICGLLVISFSLNVALVDSSPNAAFLLPPTRLWELMIGALLAQLGHFSARGVEARSETGRARWAREIASLLGIALLAAAILLIDDTSQFPGWWALLPTLGAAALVISGPAAFINKYVLSNPVLRFYGVISYPLYLWHWPLLSFPVSLGMPLTHELRVIILIAGVVLAALTHELVERPLRLERSRARSTSFLMVAWLLTMLFGWAALLTDGLESTYPDSMRIELR